MRFVRDREDDCLRAIKRVTQFARLQSALAQVGDTALADLHMAYLVVGLEQVVRDAAAHLAAGTNDRNTRHEGFSSISFNRLSGCLWREGRSPPAPSGRP